MHEPCLLLLKWIKRRHPFTVHFHFHFSATFPRPYYTRRTRRMLPSHWSFYQLYYFIQSIINWHFMLLCCLFPSTTTMEDKLMSRNEWWWWRLLKSEVNNNLQIEVHNISRQEIEIKIGRVQSNIHHFRSSI
jgi:hypothetical protein